MKNIFRKKQINPLPVIDLTNPIDPLVILSAPRDTGLMSARQGRVEFGIETATPLLRPTFLNP